MMSDIELSDIILNLKELSENKEMNTDTKITLYNLASDYKITRYGDFKHFYVVKYQWSYIILSEELEPLLISSEISSTSTGHSYTWEVNETEDKPELLEVYLNNSQQLSDEAKKALKYKSLVPDGYVMTLLDSDTLDFVTYTNDILTYTLEKITDHDDFLISIQKYYGEDYDDEYGESSGYVFDTFEICMTNASDELGIPCMTWYNFNQHKVIGAYNVCFDYGQYKWCKLVGSATKWQRFKETGTGFEPCEIKNLPKELNSTNFEHYKEYLR